MLTPIQNSSWHPTCISKSQICTAIRWILFYFCFCMWFIYPTVDIFQNFTQVNVWWGWWEKEYNTLRPRQNGRHFPDDILKWIFLNENVWISIEISLKFVTKGQINNIPALVQIMAWRRLGAKPLSEPMMVSLLTHICVTRPQWVDE